MKATCDLAASYGMIFPGDKSLTLTDVGGGGKRQYDFGSKNQNQQEKKQKEDVDDDTVLCQHCGVKGHAKPQCKRIKDTGKYFNTKDVLYSESEAWTRVQHDVKNAVKSLGYPRAPKFDSVFLDANAKTGAPNPKKGIPPYPNLNHSYPIGNQCSSCNCQ